MMWQQSPGQFDPASQIQQVKGAVESLADVSLADVDLADQEICTEWSQTGSAGCHLQLRPEDRHSQHELKQMNRLIRFFLEHVPADANLSLNFSCAQQQHCAELTLVSQSLRFSFTIMADSFSELHRRIEENFFRRVQDWQKNRQFV